MSNKTMRWVVVVLAAISLAAVACTTGDKAPFGTEVMREVYAVKIEVDGTDCVVIRGRIGFAKPVALSCNWED